MQRSILRITNTTFKNFMSYGNNVTEVVFDKATATMITGENLDSTSNGKESNGTGKTTILNAVVYGLYDRAIGDDVNKDDLINNVNKKDMVVTVDFITVTGDVCRVERSRKTKAGAAGNTVKFIKNGIDISVDSDGTNKLIADALGMPYELFIRIVVFSASKTPFLDLPVRAQSSGSQTFVLEELFNITILTNRAKELKTKIATTESDIKLEEQACASQAREIQLHTNQHQNALQRIDRWDFDTATSIITLQKQLDAIKTVDIDGQIALSQQRDVLQAKLTQDKSHLQAVERSMLTVSRQIVKTQQEIAQLTNHTCPFCEQPFADTEAKLTQEAGVLDEQHNELLDYDEHRAALESSIAATEEQYNLISSQIVVSNIAVLAKTRNDQAQLEFKLEQLYTAKNPHFEAAADFERSVPPPVSYDRLNQLKKLLDHRNFLYRLLTKNTSFLRKALLDQNLPYLNERLAHYINLLGLRYSVVFTSDMTAMITIVGRTIKFGSLSAGQKARVNLAIAFAFRAVRQRILGTTVNLCMLDEVLDVGLDGVGVQAAARLIKHEAAADGSSLYIISHREELATLFDTQLRVTFQAGFSRIGGLHES